MSLPKGFIAPCGRKCGTAAYVALWRAVREVPGHVEVRGWNWYPTQAAEVLRDIRAGVQDRINQRGGLVVRQTLPKHAERRMWAARVEALRRKGCAECGETIPETVPINPNSGAKVFCCENCRRAYV